MKYLILIELLFVLACTTEIHYPEKDGSMPTESKSGGWSASGTLHTGSDTDQVSLQAVFPEADTYTVEFNLREVDVPDPLIATRAEALITWSVEGNSVTRRVNVGNGISVTGVGQGCKVVIKDVSAVDTAGLLGKEYTVSVQVAPGERANIEQPPTLLPFPKLAGFVSGLPTILPAGGSIAVPVPQDAGVVSVYVPVRGIAPIPEFGVIVSHRNATSTVEFAVYDPRAFQWVPIAPGTQTILIANTQPADTVEVSLFFGIDG